METREIKAICDERLGKWTNRMVGEHATPVLLLGVGHDHKKGAVVICTLEDMDDTELLLFLGAAYSHLQAQVIRRQ